MSQAVMTERRGRILLITLNRPDAMNAIDAELAGELLAAVAQLDSDPELSIGVLTGAGRGFCAGMDLKAFEAGEDMSDMLTFVERGSTKPLIAAVEGFALAGGLELALTCDLIVAAERAKFGIPEVSVGLFAAAGALLRLPGRVGQGKAVEMAITGQPISAEEALQHGLVSRVVPRGQALSAALELAESVARHAPLAVAASKQVLNLAHGITAEEFWALQLPIKTAVFASDDAKEGANAFSEKRDAQWTGR